MSTQNMSTIANPSRYKAIAHNNEHMVRSPLTPFGKEIVRNTIEHLQLCRQAREQGYQVSFTTDPTWMVNQAINRRAGWPDDPGCSRGSALPIAGKYPEKAVGERFNHLRLLSYRLNTPRLVVRETELGEWRKLLKARIPDRITMREDY
jgi:hypothetical protein